jgi:hypothetical protein
MKPATRTLAALALSLPLAALAAGNNIVIGQSAPLSGSNAEIGRTFAKGRSPTSRR